MTIKLLVADDSITIQKVIGIIFSGDDYSLTVVDNGKAAVEKAVELSPDVLLIDALMPGMSGYEVCEAVRAIPQLAAKPVLILTGSFEPFDEERAKTCGADDFLAKPFESQQIINKVKELAELGASRASNTDYVDPHAQSEAAAAFATGLEATEELAPLEETSQTTSSSDISGAFTPDFDATENETEAPEPSGNGFSDSFEPDVFAIINDDSESQPFETADTPSITDQNTGTEWIPTEEQTFEFEEESFGELPQSAFSGQTDPVHDSGFDEIVLEDEAPAGLPPLSTVSTAGGLSEEQLKAAILEASKEVIERIVWEVVPDMAETMIREAIRKIKEGS